MNETAFALFDFDNTLTCQDSVVPYLLYCRKRGLCGWSQILRAVGGYLLQRMDPKQIVRAKEISFSFIKGYSQGEMDEIGRDFFRQVMSRKYLPSGIERLRQLREGGYEIVIVSASADVYMRVLPEFLPIDTVICTQCNIDEKGCYTGRIGPNCRGEEKPRRISEWLQEQSVSIDFERSVSAGDSFGDSPMMRLTRSAILVDPKKKLRNAVPHGEIVHWHRERRG